MSRLTATKMFNKKDFEDYYVNFLGTISSVNEDNISFFRCKSADRILNQDYYYPFLMTKKGNMTIFSIVEEYFDDFKKEFYENGHLDLSDFLTSFFSIRIKEFEIKKMLRFVKYTYDKSSKAVCLEKKHKKLFLNSGKNKNKVFKEKKWKEIEKYISERRYFIMTNNAEILSTAHISDVYYNGGNIVVFTTEENRQKGYAKEVVKKSIEWCWNHNVLPIYFVNSENTPSIRLSKSLHFIQETEELVVCCINETNN